MNETQTTPKPRKSRAVVVRDDAAASAPARRRSLTVSNGEMPPSSFEIRKAVETLTIRNASTAGEIHFVQRKAYNVMLRIAQEAADKDQAVYEAPIREFERLVGHVNSKNRGYLKQLLREMVSLQVEFDYREANDNRRGDWGVAAMVAEVYIIESTSTIRFSFPADFKKRLLDPSVYNRIDLRLQNQFTSYSALTLYEIVSRYFTAPVKRTFADHWTGWSLTLSGATEPHKTYREFSKMMQRAVDQVNALEKRFRVTPHVSKKNRKIDQLWFVIEDLPQWELSLESGSAAASDELLRKLRDFGIKEEELTRLCMSHAEEYLLAQADYTEARLKKKDAEPVNSPRAFFMSCVEKNFADAPRQPTKSFENAGQAAVDQVAPKSDMVKALRDLEGRWKLDKLAAIKEEFLAADSDRQREILVGIEPVLRERNSLAFEQYRKKGMSAKIVQTAVFEAILEERGESPTPERLLQFALEQNALKQ